MAFSPRNQAGSCTVQYLYPVPGVCKYNSRKKHKTQNCHFVVMKAPCTIQSAFIFVCGFTLALMIGSVYNLVISPKQSWSSMDLSPLRQGFQKNQCNLSGTPKLWMHLNNPLLIWGTWAVICCRLSFCMCPSAGEAPWKTKSKQQFLQSGTSRTSKPQTVIEPEFLDQHMVSG